ncbi:FAD-binding oxidoreductase [Labrenzia sp. VG12]|uniref:NAD(P)/FAD-dependent oxidoreductase n=1 Tax=Labrenzia sp. VG12 TaxID=2021862 RepID=UPI000B8BF36D|nr:FAD-dependent oxidoreductase [Labrenzia sp. VG12]ASP31918.1 FAD-dependent oxidoreductase [Labrenzia sp. VG12]
MAPAASDTYDVAIAGAGIFGLAIARAAIEAGLKTVVFDRAHVGAGSSGGVLGALMPHMPARWNPKKEFQFQALSCLEERIRLLETETGQTCGYARCGRILPLTTTDKLEHHLERAEESKIRWKSEETGFTYVVETAGSRSDWLDAAAAPHGIVYETLAARISPRQYLASLATFVRQHGTLLEGIEVSGFDPTSSRVENVNGQAVARARSLVVTGGFAAFDLIERLTGERVGRGEKGQALLLDGKGLEDRSAIYCDGLYVVPHANGTVAIGSTSDREFQDDLPSADRSTELLQRATAFCPSLKGRKILSDWAGIRPRCHKRDPLVGRLPGHENVFAATGGFKISFGIAHLIADALIAEISGKKPVVPLPETFRTDHHFGANRLDADS